MIPAKYTIMLKDIEDDENLIEVLNSYKIYDESYRNTLNTRILNHYAFEEIGFETPFMFCHYLKCRLDEIMDKYNMLYKSELLKLDPLVNFSSRTTFDRIVNSISSDEQNSNIDSKTTTSNESTHTSNSENNSEESVQNSEDGTSKEVYQNTPQGEISSQTISNYTYATNQTLKGNENSSSGSSESSSENNLEESSTSDTTDSNIQKNSFTNESQMNNIENYVKNITGNNNITTSKLYQEFVDNFKSIDSLIINELCDLFMGIF